MMRDPGFGKETYTACAEDLRGWVVHIHSNVVDEDPKKIVKEPRMVLGRTRDRAKRLEDRGQVGGHQELTCRRRLLSLKGSLSLG